LISAFLYSYSVGVPYHHDRARHFAHHRRVGFRDDPDWVNYTNETRETPSKLRRYLIGKLLGSLLFSTLWNALLKSEPRIKSGTTTNIKTEGVNEFVWIIFTQLILFVGLYLSIGWWAYPFFWLAPLATLTAFFNNTRAFVEHSVEDDNSAPEQRLKDIGATTLEQHFYSPAHFHLHALHHQYPSIPHHRLEESKSFIIKEAGIYPFQVTEGYWRSLNQHIKSLSKRQADSGSAQ
jgi:fatty acid desaturase